MPTNAFYTNSPLTQAIPFGLEDVQQFVCSRAGTPCDCHGVPSNAFDPVNHRLPGVAVADAAQGLQLGFVLTANDPFFLIDIDGVYDPATGWAQVAHDLLSLFHGAFVEVSSSGRGLHIIGSGAGAVPANHRCRVTPNVEFYTQGRVVTLTGWHRAGNARADMSGQLVEFMRRFEVGTREPVRALTSEIAPGYDGPADDDLLLQAMCSAPGSFAMMYGERCHPRALFVGDGVEIAKHYPAGRERTDGLLFDASTADMALCGHLAFWTGKDAARMERLWLRSWLGQRPKVQARADYRSRTIAAACAGRTEVYDQQFKRTLIAAIGSDERVPDIRPMILTLEQMREKLVFIEATGEVVHMDLGRPRSWVNALGAYAGSIHQWETTDGKIKEAAALTVWRRDKGRISVDVQTWAPGRPKVCFPPEVRGGDARAFNIWLGLREPVAPATDRIQPFLEHLEFLVPVEAERKRFLQWLAHIIQKPEVLPHTGYLMVTRQTGVGRNWLASVMAQTLRGYVAMSVKIGQILDGGFNGCLSQKLLAVVDEAREGMDEKRYAKANALKELITQEARLINPKFGHQCMEYNCTRWLMFSNHLDALPIDNMDRRIVVIQNPEVRRPQQDYTMLYSLLYDGAFISSVFHYLKKYDISGFNAGEPAQMTAIKHKIIDAGTSELEKLVFEFKEECQTALTTMARIKAYVTGHGLTFRDNALAHAIDKTGMERVSKRVRLNGQRVSIVCVHSYNPEQVALMSIEQILSLL